MPTRSSQKKSQVNLYQPLYGAGKKPQVAVKHAPHPNLKFESLPAATGSSPYHLSLENVLPADEISDMKKSGIMSFQLTGDTGGVKFPEPQQIVEMGMRANFDPSTAVSSLKKPSFFYHVGDVVYFYGEDKDYYDQFYEPYANYPAPIFAIPGNHDGSINPQAPTSSLEGFVTNFCSKDLKIVADAGEVDRVAMIQPNVFWTLETPLATFIGLYSNVPEGGEIQDDQIKWFTGELESAPKNKALIVSVHHPPYSMDVHHSGSTVMQNVLDNGFKESNRYPDIVFSGHVHNFQRFTRKLDDGRQIPYIVAGGGGYWNLHYLQKVNGNLIEVPFSTPDPEVTLESYSENHHGFMQLEITQKSITGEYYNVPRPQESWGADSEKVDAFAVDLKNHTVNALSTPP